MTRFNLSDWALRHRSFVWYLMIVALIAGSFSYMNMGREEDPNFSIKTMIIAAALPGADIEDTRAQVTDRIEKKLEELDTLKATRSVTAAGRTVVYVDLLPTTPAAQIPATWQRVRNMMTDIQADFPAEFAGFQFNDSFGDVFGNIYAFTADGFTPRELHDYVETVRTEVQSLPDAGKIDLIGVREEVIYMEFSVRRMAALGLNKQQVVATLASQNALVPSGVIDAGDEQVIVRVSGQFDDADSLAAVNLRVGDRFFNVGDIATITRGYKDPADALFRVNGKEGVALAIGMKQGGNILDFGEQLKDMMTEIQAKLPVGIEMQQVADQPDVVEHAVGHFIQALMEAIGIVLLVTFVSLGMRAGVVVTLTIPLVLAITFVILDYYGITLQRISLGALIIALGLLVDDAMIAIETMISRLELGESLTTAASYAWTSIAFPMLSGTLVTVVGFIPIGLNNSAAGEFTFSLFVVIAVSLMVSWVVAVLFAPLLGVTFLPEKGHHHDSGPGRIRRAFHVLLRRTMRAKWLTVIATLAIFACSIWGMKFVEFQFFPSSDRPELIVDVTARQNSSIIETEAQMDRLEATLQGNPDIDHWTSYVGRGAPRFLLTLEGPTPGPYLGQLVIQATDTEARDRVRAQIDGLADQFPGVELFTKLLELGPPVGKPVQYRLSGPETGIVRDQARLLAAALSQDDRLTNISLDWSEPARVVRVEIDQDKARQLGVSASDISSVLNGVFNGQTVTQLRDSTYLVSVVARGDTNDRQSVDALHGMQLQGNGGASVPLLSLATLKYDTEQPMIMQRDRLPTITVKASVATKDQPISVVQDLAPQIDALRSTLPIGYKIEVGGTLENTNESTGPIVAVVPIMVLLMTFLVMIQMQSFRLSLIVLSAAPLGLIGVVAALVPSGAPLGFVAILGVLALVGILIRNSIILVHEIEELRRQGRSRWDAVFEASDSRARPILLTAAAASLALIPIARQVFWGPMAYSMMGGIIAGTLVTLIFVPALYLLVYGVKPPKEGAVE
ncbi:efflux RND transporter permease subunit [Thalassovita taeanensis]|uniref:Multidrug efflux pump subunit AcrB n=1 Tax=Thalassovita taeanensis TaxID=657014 RepID=A0A1H8Z1S1_9RHOB|nr:efflux RND transporter permease subunit [Thalassovita taeanensis]SEP58306.1 Multidrug efflux pump subunit AcrB [Thalassovita taeanensis]